MGIRVGNLDGTGAASTLFGGESVSLFAALLKAPVNTRLPEISGGAKVGRELTRQNGSWASDLLGRSCHDADQLHLQQWKPNGSNIATGRTFTPYWPATTPAP